MKIIMRKLFAAVLAVVAVLSAGLALTACNNNSPNTTDNACENVHSYNKNVCERCGNTLTDLSEFPEAYRNEIANRLLLVAPRTKEMDDYVSSTRLLQDAETKVTECNANVTKAQAVYDEARNQNPVNISQVTAAQTALLKAELELTQAETDLKTCKAGYELNCEGYAWNLAVMHIKATDASNYGVNRQLVFLAETEMTALNTTTMPTWYNEIVSNIETITGLDIKTGA